MKNTGQILIIITIVWLFSTITYLIINKSSKESNFDLPEELPYVTSKDSLNPDTVLIYKHNNQLIIKFKDERINKITR